MKSILLRRWLALACIALVGGTGFYLSRAAEKPATIDVKSRLTLAQTITQLDTTVVLEGSTKGTTCDQLLCNLSKQKNVFIRMDQAWFRGLDLPDLENINEKQLQFDIPSGLTLRETLDELCRDLAYRNGEGVLQRPAYTIKAGHILIGDGYTQIDPENASAIQAEKARNQQSGPTVSLAVENKTLPEIVAILREQTGANIVLLADEAATKKTITVTLSDVKLLTALSVVAEFCDHAAVSSENVFRITTPAKAEKIHRLAKQSTSQLIVSVPVDKDGKFVPPGEFGDAQGCMTFGPIGPRLVPYTVEQPAQKK